MNDSHKFTFPRQEIAHVPLELRVIHMYQIFWYNNLNSGAEWSYYWHLGISDI